MKCAGGTVVCMASGPSMDAADAAKVMAWRDAAPGRFVVAVNTTFRLVPHADAMFAMDITWWRAFAAEVAQKFTGERYTSVAGGEQYGVQRARDGTRVMEPYGNSGCGAVALAVLSGASRVILLGYDCQKTDGRAHWHEDYKDLGNAGSINRWGKQFAALREYTAGRAEVINATRITAMVAYPQMSLEDALALPDPPMTGEAAPVAATKPEPRTLPVDTVRGAIRNYILTHAGVLGDDVLEVGSRIHNPIAWWCSNRDLAAGKWTGIDMQPGEGVDMVADMEQLPAEWTDRFTGAVCSEVLEHVKYPDIGLRELFRVVKPGAVVLLTTLTAFPLHGYPNDYRRWTEAGLRLELERAGFVVQETRSAGTVGIPLNDHGAETVQKTCPRQVFAKAVKPC